MPTDRGVVAELIRRAAAETALFRLLHRHTPAADSARVRDLFDAEAMQCLIQKAAEVNNVD